jgi:hemerythrin-like metal-binding protein
MNESVWKYWVMHTARKLGDVEGITKKTGISTLDSNSQRLIELALQFNLFVHKTRHGFAKLEYIEQGKILLQQFVRFAERQFEFEENLIEKYKLENFELQQTEHRALLELLRDHIDEYEMGHLAIILELKRKIWAWIEKHINLTDFDTFNIDKWNAAIESAQTYDDIAVIAASTRIDKVDQRRRVLFDSIFELDNEAVANGQSEQVGSLEITLETIYHNASMLLECERHFAQAFRMDDLYAKAGQDYLTLIESYRESIKANTSTKLAIKHNCLQQLLRYIGSTEGSPFAADTWETKVCENAKSWGELAWVIYPTGLETIDKGHRQVVEASLSFRSALNEDMATGSEGVSKGLQVADNLEEVCARFLAIEETILYEMGMLDLANHQSEHQYLLKSIIDIRDDLEVLPIAYVLRYSHWVLGWLVNHINTGHHLCFRDGNLDVAYGSVAKEDRGI